KDVSILGLASDSDWILSGPTQYDTTFIHNAYIFEISRRIGQWAPRTVFVEMFFNQNGGKLDYSDYAGVYVLTEKIKSGKDRLDIAGINPGDNAGTALTGGYIFKIDRPDGGEYAWTISNATWGLGTMPNQESGQSLVLVEPDPDFDTTQQQDYIRNTAILPWNNTLFTERAANFTTRNYRNYIDVRAFIDHHLLNSLAYNVDALRLSAFYFKDRGGKIAAGPIWDFDRALFSGDRDSSPASWANIDYFFNRDWWNGLFKDPQFVQEWVDRWWQLREPGQPFEQTVLNALADQMGAQIGSAAGARDAAKWPADVPHNGNYTNEIARMKTWLGQRTAYIDSTAPAPPAASVVSGPVAAGTQVTLSGTGTIRYTLDGTDPRPFGGGTPGTGSTYSAPLTINATTVLTARRQSSFTPFPSGASSISWSAPRTRVYLVNETFASAASIAVSEINYHPAAPTPAEVAAAPGTVAEDYEWIELKNVGAGTMNTFEMVFPAGYPFDKELRLAPLSIAPGGTALLVRNRTAFQARYGTSQNAKIAGEWVTGSLSDGGEEVRLMARDGSPVASFTYSDGNGWPDRADGHGSTLEYTGAAYATTDYNLAANWRSSPEVNGTPGTASAGPDTRVVINEVLSNSSAPRVDAIELRNNSGAAVDVGGWYLSDAGNIDTVTEYQKFAIPAGTVIPAGGYLVLTETSFNPNGAWNPAPGAIGPNEFAFDGQHGDDAWLLSNTGGVLRFADHVKFGAARPDESWGRLPNGTGPVVPMLTRTLLDEASATVPRPGLGADNTAVRTGPLIIQEIQHAPAGGLTDLEFVEILNPTASDVSLANWRLRGDVDYNFGTETVAAGGVIVVVPFAPSDTTRANSFRSTYGITESVVLAGPWDGSDHLSTNGKVTLYRAEASPVTEP
ncbi:MAG TPA: lamin tail domain-containing protein, partial [Verrucomicrobiales bacterium]|nr:lamin tail domain-containing protein [Verrucomicrobiales bacterium]